MDRNLIADDGFASACDLLSLKHAVAPQQAICGGQRDTTSWIRNQSRPAEQKMEPSVDSL
jgi:hypothetical protein